MKTIWILTILIAGAIASPALDEFAQGNRNFTAKLFEEVLGVNGNTNFIFSPFSVQVILALTRAGAKGQTASEFTTALSLPSEEVTQEALKQLLIHFDTSEDQLKLLTANKLYLGQKFELLDSFKSLATDHFAADIENVDFSQSPKAISTINNWVEKRTNHKIKDLVTPHMVDASTKLVLVNALYFNAKWRNPFKDFTKIEKFHVSNTKTKDVMMMNVMDRFKYYESPELGAKFLELPYRAKSISMTIVLPNEKQGLSAIEKNLPAVFSPQNLEFESVYVKLPAFSIETKVDLVPHLQKLGLKTVFSSAADLSGISKEGLAINVVVQKAFINVTTSGTEAAAATAIGFTRSGHLLFGPSLEFIADHPFLYYIKVNGIIIFAGQFSNV